MLEPKRRTQISRRLIKEETNREEMIRELDSAVEILIRPLSPASVSGDLDDEV